MICSRWWRFFCGLNSKRTTAYRHVNHVSLLLVCACPIQNKSEHLVGKSKCVVWSNQFNFDGAIYLEMFLVSIIMWKNAMIHLNDGRDTVLTNLIDWLWWCESYKSSVYISFVHNSSSSSVPFQRKRRSLRCILA